VSKPIENPPSLVDILAREHAARAARIDAEADAPRSRSAATALATSDTQVDVDAHGDTAVDIVAPVARVSSPRILVEELTRECAKRRAALDDEARRG